MKDFMNKIPSNNVFLAFLESFCLYLLISILLSFINIKYDGNMYYSLLSYIGISCIVLLYYLIKKDLNMYNIKTNNDNKKIIFISISLIIIATIINLIIVHFIGKSPNEELNINYLEENFCLSSIKMIIFSPIIEEFMFRYPYRKVKSNNLLAFILYSFFFAFCHLTLQSSTEFIYLIPYTILSLGIGFSFYKTNNIVYSTLIHMLNNLIVILFIEIL